MRIFGIGIFYIIFVFIIVSIGVFYTFQFISPSTPDWVTTQVDRGDVNETVSVSGFIEAEKTADLAFPNSGIVTDIFVEEGSLVKAGEILATLAATQLVAERAEAVSALTAARANYNKTIAGPRSETLAVANTSLKNAEENLIRVTAEEARKVKNAKTALLSTGLTATTEDINENSTAPVVSGTYNCEADGVYNLSVYSSGGKSGYSYNYSGIENGNASVGIEQPSPLGSCGLYLLFTAGNYYSNSNWQIQVPNTRNPNYTTLNNAYNLALTQSQNAIAAAKNALTLAQKESGLSNAPARSEDVTSAAATVSQAEARIAAIDAKISDRSIISPFTGVVTSVTINKGEAASSLPIITVLADDVFVLKARIPEIDITKIVVGQDVNAVFDAQSNETILGKITFISPIASQVDGVAYFETKVTLNTSPTWLRVGLNADIEILTKSKEQVLRIPKRFVTTLSDGTHVVSVPNGNKTATTTVEVIFVGNDSYMEITGLAEGTIVVAP